mgnify:CR=1 FL=1
MLLRRGIVYDGARTWTRIHDAWLRRVRRDHVIGMGPSALAAFDDAYDTVVHTTARRDRLDEAIAGLYHDGELAPTARRLACLRGVSALTAVSLAVEIGDWSRFKGSTIASVRAVLEERGALEYTTIVASPASDPAGFKYLSPYTGSAIGQHWMYQGKHVLIVFDDLSKQAEAYRAVSLLLRRPPGREAYPGDVFYLHSRLLERCAKLSDDLGAGSMTGLPIIETKANDVSAYIPTNVISITDGQIFLQSDLFNADQRPAVDVGISVSRVGGAAQVKAMKKVAGTLKITLAQYRSMQAFAMFASDLDAATRAQLTRGERLMELLKQPQYTPYPVAEQVASVWAGTKGYLDDIDVSDVLPFEAAFLDHLRRNTDILDTIESTGQLTDETEEALVKAVEAFRRTFASGEQMLGAQVAEPEEEPTAERTTEQLVVKRG